VYLNRRRCCIGFRVFPQGSPHPSLADFRLWLRRSLHLFIVNKLLPSFVSMLGHPKPARTPAAPTGRPMYSTSRKSASLQSRHILAGPSTLNKLEANSNYCSQEGDFSEFDTRLNTEGERSDLKTAKQASLTLSFDELLDHPVHCTVVARSMQYSLSLSLSRGPIRVLAISFTGFALNKLSTSFPPPHVEK
jgi:hypothetical protein